MILPEVSEPSVIPKLIQPRSHKAKVCVWSDLSIDDVDKLNESQGTEYIKQVLSEKFHLGDHKENLKSGIILDLYFYTVQFAQDNGFTKEKLSTFFSIVKKTHEVCTETPFGNVDQTFNYFKELVLCHAVNRPPYSIELFTADEVRKITEYTVNTYFRHFKMYKYAFTPLVRLDLSLSYVGMEPSPPPSEAGEQPQPLMEDPEEEKREEGEMEGQDRAASAVAAEDAKASPDPDEPEAKKELRTMIQTYLTDEIKKMKTSIEDHLKSTEETLNKKLEAAEGGSKSGKGNRGSAKGKKK